jgi:hypothetical protein
LYYYRARYYDPKIGRFISEDPISFLGGINFYTYVEGNSVNLTDPSGLGSMGQCIGGYQQFAHFAGQVRQLGDKVAHCMAHCELVKACGWAGKIDSFLMLSPGKEAYDQTRGDFARIPGMIGLPVSVRLPVLDDRAVWEWDDINANQWGRTCPANMTCWDRCSGAQTLFSSGN